MESWKSQCRNDWNDWKEEPKPAHPKGSQPPDSQIPRQHPGEYLYTFEGFVMSTQGETPLERRMEGPIRVPYWSVPLEGPTGEPC